MKCKIINLNINVKGNETRFLVQHESCEYKCGLNESVHNLKQQLSLSHDFIGNNILVVINCHCY